MNGDPLPAQHGFPVRLVVPGFYGTNSVKWLSRMTLNESRAPGPFTTRWYNDPVLDGFGMEIGATTPVWSTAPESLIVSPSPHDTVDSSTMHEIWGWAWADGGVRSVYVRADDAASWRRAELEAPRGREWQRLSMRWPPGRRGPVVLACMAEAMNGMLQRHRGDATQFMRYLSMLLEDIRSLRTGAAVLVIALFTHAMARRGIRSS